MFWLNGWVFVYKLSGCGFDSSCSHEKYYCVENARLSILKMFARSFSSQWHDFSTVTGTIVQQSLARLFNNHWHDSSTVASTILQQSRARFFLFSTLAEFFNSDAYCWRIVPCTRNMTHDPNTVLNSRGDFKLIWDKILKNVPTEICGRQPLKNLKWHGLLKQAILEYFVPYKDWIY